MRTTGSTFCNLEWGACIEQAGIAALPAAGADAYPHSIAATWREHWVGASRCGGASARCVCRDCGPVPERAYMLRGSLKRGPCERCGRSDRSKVNAAVAAKRKRVTAPACLNNRTIAKITQGCHGATMTIQPPGAVPPLAPIYRLRVRAAPLKSRQFLWEIVDENHAIAVQTSERTFRSMEDAYGEDQASLEHWRQRANRQLASSGSLGQQKPGRPVR
jgi:hypothetical protein